VSGDASTIFGAGAVRTDTEQAGFPKISGGRLCTTVKKEAAMADLLFLPFKILGFLILLPFRILGYVIFLPLKLLFFALSLILMVILIPVVIVCIPLMLLALPVMLCLGLCKVAWHA
jgi:hypothetical protein